MAGVGCTVDGNLNNSKFSQPMPLIGIYIATASATCAIAMAVDAFYGFRHQKLWFPSKYFSLNATTLTLIAIAIKLSVDLNTSMPRRQDQLAKLSSSALICTVMGNSIPSLGNMKNKEILMNIVALGILVITAIVNICIQLDTGVIYVFWKEHALIMFLMLVLLATMSSTALTVPTTKKYFDLKYNKKHKIALQECSENDVKCSASAKKLRNDLTRFWMMAHTCSPQFVIGRSATCTASGALCLLAAMTLAEATLRSYFMPWSIKFCSGESDYMWSTTLVLVTQIVAVIAGTIAPAFRWFTAINFRCPKKANKACKPTFQVEKYWIQILVEWKECPLALQICGQYGRKLTHDVKNLILDLCIGMQTGIVLASKLVSLVSIYFMSWFLISYRSCKKLTWFLQHSNTVGNNDSGSESQPGSELDLSRFVLYLEGEEELVDLMMENNCDVSHWILMGKKRHPKFLIQLLAKSTSSQELKGVSEFDNDRIASLDAEEPPNCWALPVVTLTSIAIALPNIDHHSIKQLIRSVNEGLIYARFVENNLNAEGEFINIRKAAEIVWLGIDLYHKWLDVDLHKIALQEKNPEKVLKELADIAKNRFLEFRKKDVYVCLRESPSHWPIKVLAANSMYRICQTILLDYEMGDYNDSSERLFQRLSNMIADILGACLTNLPRVIPMDCHRSTIEEREESVRHAIVLLGKAHKILEMLDQQPLPSADPEQLASIDAWRSLSKQKNSPEPICSSTVSDTTAFRSSDVYLSID
ncbi:unnamed protein product [Camellia sinensis]